MHSVDQENEVKFYIRALDALARRILALGGRLQTPRTYELNLRFDTADGDLTRTGRVLRLRRDQAIRLTYKDGGRLVDGALSRREIEVGVADFDAARRMLEALGYRPIFTYEKYRTTYRLAAADVMLDELPFGTFVEIEGAPAVLKPLALDLGLDWSTAVPDSYHVLFEHLRSASALPYQDLTFANFAGTAVHAIDLGLKPADRS